MRTLYLFLWTGIIGLLVAGGCTAVSAPEATLPTDIYLGDLVDPPIQVQDFTLPSSRPEVTQFSDLDGTWRLIFFGYMRCPDFCPLTLVDYRFTKQLLGDAANQVSFVFISVDAARDTPELMRDYLANFDSEFVGFTGDDDTLSRIQPDYGFYYERRLGSGEHDIYTIDHSTRSYLVDPDGVLRATFPYATKPDQLAAALYYYLGQSTPDTVISHR